MLSVRYIMLVAFGNIVTFLCNYAFIMIVVWDENLLQFIGYYIIYLQFLKSKPLV
jgi:hypothetical protein